MRSAVVAGRLVRTGTATAKFGATGVASERRWLDAPGWVPAVESCLAFAILIPTTAPRRG